MGLTKLSKERVMRTIVWKSQEDKETVGTVIELGAQNLYDKAYPEKVYAKDFYVYELNMLYQCIDLNGDNLALKVDLEKPIKPFGQFDLVTDFGTSEHIQNLHQCWTTIHSLCKVGGMIICENPKVDNWEGHGYNYRTKRFYEQLAKAMDYQIIEIREEPAMGNEIDGWNICCILKKLSDKTFVNKTQFNKFDFKYLKNQRK